MTETGFAEQFWAFHRMGPALICMKTSDLVQNPANLIFFRFRLALRVFHRLTIATWYKSILG
jgi:hypothetical protein